MNWREMATSRTIPFVLRESVLFWFFCDRVLLGGLASTEVPLPILTGAASSSLVGVLGIATIELKGEGGSGTMAGECLASSDSSISGGRGS